MERKKQQLYSEFLDVSKETGLPMKKIFDTFYLLSSGEAIENNKLLREVGVSKNNLNQVKKSLSHLLTPPSHHTKLDPQEIEDVKKLFGEEHTLEEQIFSLLENDQYRKTLNLLLEVSDQRPDPDRELDQFTATPQTTAKRASLLNFFKDIQDKKLLFLGDDDLTSLAVANYKTAKRITVLDIDRQVLDTAKHISQKYSLDIETIKYDAREKIPQNILNKYDVVFIDPPYTPSGFSLFISRSIDALDVKNKASRIYACYGNSDRAKERFIPIQQKLTQSGLMVRWAFDKFNRYHGAESIGSASSLYVIETTPKTKPLIKREYRQPIYTYQQTSRL